MKLEKLRRLELRNKRLNFRQFVAKVNPRYRWFRHCEILGDVLEQVASGKRKRVMIFMPPRHGKSEEVSRLFTAYFLYLYPHRWVGLSSYAADLAFTLSRAARANYVAAGGALQGDARASAHWETGEGGGMWAAGVGGPITGKGAHLLVIDDPIKNAEEASSDATQLTHQEWYSSTFYTREEPWSDTDPDGAIIVIQTRWHEMDLAGWLLDQETQGDDPENWHIVNYPAIAEEAHTFPPTCTTEPDWREIGEPLCPERRPLSKLNEIANRIGQYFFGALFQQRPIAKGGRLIKRSFFRSVTMANVPPLVNCVFGADLAVSAKTTADYTVCGPLGVDGRNNYYLFRPARGQWEPADARREMITRIQTFRSVFPVSTIGLESVAALSGYVTEMRNEPQMAGYMVADIGRKTDKVLLAAGWIPIAEQGRIYLVDDGSGWIETFLRECESFPLGKKDDQVDWVGISFEALRLSGSMEVISQGKHY